jgi:bifunctional non-homologous end joining protein LigD
MTSRKKSLPARREKKATPLPLFVRPQLSALVTKPPNGGSWIHELKYDGFRMHLRKDGKDTKFLTRTGLDWTENYAPVVRAARKIKAKTAYIDGEMCAVLPDGTTSFPELQAGGGKLVYYAFDLLHLNGQDLTRLPLMERKALLSDLINGLPPDIRYSQEFQADATAFLDAACRLGTEGIISKRVDAPYTPDDRGLWQKSKCYKREEFVIVGYTNPENGGAGTSSVLLGYYKDGRLVYAGRGGGGMSEKKSLDLARQLRPLIVDKMPVDKPPPKTSRFGSPLKLSQVHWVQPKLVAEIRYLSWTTDGYLRHPTFIALRPDKTAKDVTRDDSRNLVEPTPAPPRNAARSVPEKVERRFSKNNIQRRLEDAAPPPKDLLRRYWKKVGKRALKYLARRPLTLVRSVGGATFFHEGPLPEIPPSVHKVSITKSDRTKGVRVWVDDVQGLLGLVDMDVVEIHPWQSTVDDIEHADLIVIDLDPGDGLPWDFVCDTALMLREDLKGQGYDPWVKTSGGKGLHVMVPLSEPQPWAEVRSWSKAFVEEFSRHDDRYVTLNSPGARAGKLFLDYLRNGRGNTAVGTFSPRARARWPLSYPVTWTAIKRRQVQPTAYRLQDLAPNQLTEET